MNILCTSFSNMRKRILNKDSKIVLFGAGVLGQITTSYILHEYNLIDRIICYLDNDNTKWGTNISVFTQNIPVLPPNFLNECDEGTVIIINVSRFYDVMKQLKLLRLTANMDCYIMGMMLIHNFCLKPSNGNPIFKSRQLIPKKIHYMWLGGKTLPNNLKKCIESWKRFCPDYEIIQWDEHNYDIGKHPYMKAAYDVNAYGFVPDFARLDILYEHGGIYMDTDVEVKKNLDSLLYQEAFCGVEKWQVINFGGCSGATKNNQTIKHFLDNRKNVLFFDDKGNKNKNTCGFYDTKVAINLGYKINGTSQHINGMNIYAFDYFHPYDYMSGSLMETSHTYSVHWFNASWLDSVEREVINRTSSIYNVLYHSCLIGE